LLTKVWPLVRTHTILWSVVDLTHNLIQSIVGNTMTVRIERDNKAALMTTGDMSNSGYDIGGQYMCFKAVVYLQDKTGNDDDYAQVTYYALDNKH